LVVELRVLVHELDLEQRALHVGELLENAE
jgi:hypothetical protein